MNAYITNEIFPRFIKNEPVLEIKPLNAGHINNTFRIKTEKNTYVLQQINTHVFKKPAEVMHNIVVVTSHLKNKIIEAGGDPARETLTFYPVDTGEYFYKTEDDAYFRLYEYIGDVSTYQIVENPLHFRNAGEAFGNFQNMLSDFPADTLFETIENFHHTPLRFAALERAIEEDKMGRAKNVKDLIDFALARKSEASLLVDGIQNGSLPVRVTHNDTKFNNVLIDNKTQKGICIIDLDTVMPGSMLYDFGDAIRFGTNTAAEDEPDLTKVNMDLNLYREYTEGYLGAVKDSIRPAELALLPMSAKIITMEIGIRFLTDYLEGDVYFKTEYEAHNIHRTATQMKLVSDMEKSMRKMEQIAENAMQ